MPTAKMAKIFFPAGMPYLRRKVMMEPLPIRCLLYTSFLVEGMSEEEQADFVHLLQIALENMNRVRV